MGLNVLALGVRSYTMKMFIVSEVTLNKSLPLDT